MAQASYTHCRLVSTLLYVTQARLLKTNDTQLKCFYGNSPHGEIQQRKNQSKLSNLPQDEICPGLNANEIQIPYDKHHKVSSLVKCHQNTHNSGKYMYVWVIDQV